MRYLLYNIDKHQNIPWLSNTLHVSWIQDAEAGLTAIVDLHNSMVYCGTEGWKSIEKRL